MIDPPGLPAGRVNLSNNGDETRAGAARGYFSCVETDEKVVLSLGPIP